MASPDDQTPGTIGPTYPEGPSTQYLRTLVPNTIRGMVVGSKGLKYWVLGPSGLWSYLESQWPIVWGYFQPIMGYFGVKWPITLGYLAFQVLEAPPR